jgi:hypothetical protein
MSLVGVGIVGFGSVGSSPDWIQAPDYTVWRGLLSRAKFYRGMRWDGLEFARPSGAFGFGFLLLLLSRLAFYGLEGYSME